MSGVGGASELSIGESGGYVGDGDVGGGGRGDGGGDGVGECELGRGEARREKGGMGGGSTWGRAACTWPIKCEGGGVKGVNRALRRKAPEAVVLGLLRRWCRVVGAGGCVICSREVKSMLDDEAVWAVIDSWWGQGWRRELEVSGGDRRDVDGMVELMRVLGRRVKVIVKGWGDWGVGVGEGVFGAASIRNLDEASVMGLFRRNRDTLRYLNFNTCTLPHCTALSRALSMVGELSSLHTLNLYGNRISVAGASALASALGRDGALPSLYALYLGNNNIGDDGASVLASALGRTDVLPFLHILSLYSNGIGDESASKLRTARPDVEVYCS